VFLLSALVILTFFSSRGWQSWDLEYRPLIPEGMAVLVDDDLRLEDGPAAPRPVIGLPDPLYGERPGAVVVLRPRQDAQTRGCPGTFQGCGCRQAEDS
jgi:hypothetical protein